VPGYSKDVESTRGGYPLPPLLPPLGPVLIHVEHGLDLERRNLQCVRIVLDIGGVSYRAGAVAPESVI
jgi:hypothetical protein